MPVEKKRPRPKQKKSKDQPVAADVAGVTATQAPTPPPRTQGRFRVATFGVETLTSMFPKCAAAAEIHAEFSPTKGGPPTMITTALVIEAMRYAWKREVNLVIDARCFRPDFSNFTYRHTGYSLTHATNLATKYPDFPDRFLEWVKKVLCVLGCSRHALALVPAGSQALTACKTDSQPDSQPKPKLSKLGCKLRYAVELMCKCGTPFGKQSGFVFWLGRDGCCNVMCSLEHH